MQKKVLRRVNDCNGIQTYIHLVRKWALNHLAQQT